MSADDLNIAILKLSLQTECNFFTVSNHEHRLTLSLYLLF